MKRVMRVGIAFCLVSLNLWAGTLPDLHRAPGTVPDELHARLARLMTNAAGQKATTAAEWTRRREELQEDWSRFLGGFPSVKCALSPEFLEKEDLGTHTRQRVSYLVEAGVRIDAMLLEPKSKSRSRLPGLVLFHPTYSNHFARVVGIDRDDPERYQAVQWVESGYVVLAPRCFIYSELPPGWQKTNERIYEAATRWMKQRHPAWRGMTRMTWDGIRALDFMETLPGVDPERLGIFGHSLGAKEVLYVAAFDPRVKCTVFSEGGIGTAFSNWNDAWYLGPDIRRAGFEHEHHELLALVAPRAFLLLAGNSADDDRSGAFIHAVLPVYELLGAKPKVGWFNHGLGHRYGGAARTVAEEFVARELGGEHQSQP